MEVFAHVKFVRMSPRKVKLVCDMIRGKDVKTAAALLGWCSEEMRLPLCEMEEANKAKLVAALKEHGIL